MILAIWNYPESVVFVHCRIFLVKNIFCEDFQVLLSIVRVLVWRQIITQAAHQRFVSNTLNMETLSELYSWEGDFFAKKSFCEFQF